MIGSCYRFVQRFLSWLIFISIMIISALTIHFTYLYDIYLNDRIEVLEHALKAYKTSWELQNRPTHRPELSVVESSSQVKEEEVSKEIQEIHPEVTIEPQINSSKEIDIKIEKEESSTEPSKKEPSKKEPSKKEPSKKEPSKKEPSKEKDPLSLLIYLEPTSQYQMERLAKEYLALSPYKIETKAFTKCFSFSLKQEQEKFLRLCSTFSLLIEKRFPTIIEKTQANFYWAFPLELHALVACSLLSALGLAIYKFLLSLIASLFSKLLGKMRTLLGSSSEE